MLAYWKNDIIESDQIQILPNDLGLLRGYAIFDVLPVEVGNPFLWERHWDRFAKSAESIGLSLPIDRDTYREALGKLIEASGERDITLRTVLSGGPSGNGFSPEPGRETFYILAEERHRLPEEVYERGVKLVTLEYVRPLPQVKFANHAVSIADLPRRREESAFDTLYVWQGMVSEASQGNILIVKNGVLRTPRDEVLWGITQGYAMELASSLWLETEWQSLSIDEVLDADEVLLTGSSKGIVPVVRIDDHVIGEGKPGKTTQALMEAYREKTLEKPLSI